MHAASPRLTVRAARLAAGLLLGAAANARAWDAMQFDLPSGCKEGLWRDALAARLGGVTEMATAVGRVDVSTSNEVFELDWPHKWKEGMGQALAYSGATGRRPVLVLISYSQGPERLQAQTRGAFDRAEKECLRHGVRLLVLFPSRPEDFPHAVTNRPAGRQAGVPDWNSQRRFRNGRDGARPSGCL